MSSCALMTARVGTLLKRLNGTPSQSLMVATCLARSGIFQAHQARKQTATQRTKSAYRKQRKLRCSMEQLPLPSSRKSFESRMISRISWSGLSSSNGSTIVQGFALQPSFTGQNRLKRADRPNLVSVISKTH